MGGEGKKNINKCSRANYQYFKESGEAINRCEFLSCYKSSKGIRRLSCFCSICLTQLTSLGRWAEAGSKAGTFADTCCGGEAKSFPCSPPHSHEYLRPHASTLSHVCTCANTARLICLYQPIVNIYWRRAQPATPHPLPPGNLCLSSYFLFSCQNSFSSADVFWCSLF